MEKSEIFIVEDNPIVTESLTTLINRDPELHVCGEADRGFKALEEILAREPDMAIVDIGLPDMDGIELVRSLRKSNRNLRILVLSMLDELSYGGRAISAGARGYLMKQNSVNTIMQAIHAILEGKTFISDQLAAQLGDLNKQLGGEGR